MSSFNYVLKENQKFYIRWWPNLVSKVKEKYVIINNVTLVS